MPLYEDWVSAAELIRRLDRTLRSFPCVVHVVLVDDGSVQTVEAKDFHGAYTVMRAISVLRLRRNLGHQRAISLGLVHLEQSVPCDAVLIMDADGEDTAEGALQLLRSFEQTGGKEAVFAERVRRTESLWFRVFYHAYRVLHRILTGVSVRVGNFSILPRSYLTSLVVMSELWNHYAASVFRSRLPFSTTPISRGNRIDGSSKMNFTALAVHGMSAISVFSDTLGVRVLIGSLVAALMVLIPIVAVVVTGRVTDTPVATWAKYALGMLVIVFIQLITLAATFAFTTMSNRINLSFVPLRDYQFFVSGVQDVYGDG